MIAVCDILDQITDSARYGLATVAIVRADVLADLTARDEIFSVSFEEAWDAAWLVVDDFLATNPTGDTLGARLAFLVDFYEAPED